MSDDLAPWEQRLLDEPRCMGDHRALAEMTANLGRLRRAVEACLRFRDVNSVHKVSAEMREKFRLAMDAAASDELFVAWLASVGDGLAVTGPARPVEDMTHAVVVCRDPEDYARAYNEGYADAEKHSRENHEESFGEGWKAARDLAELREDEQAKRHRRDWADYLEQYDSNVGATPLTVERVIALLRSERPPFGKAAGCEGAA